MNGYHFLENAMAVPPCGSEVMSRLWLDRVAQISFAFDKASQTVSAPGQVTRATKA